SDTLLQNFTTGCQHALSLLRIALVEQQNRMNVSIAGVEHINDADIMPLSDFSDPAKNVRQLRARHHPILRAITRAQSPNAPERPLAALPKFQSLFGRFRRPHLTDSALLA